jgi:hypothetical protein
MFSVISVHCQEGGFKGGFWEAGKEPIEMKVDLKEDASYFITLYSIDTVYFEVKGTWSLKGKSLILSEQPTFLKAAPRFNKHWNLKVKLEDSWKKRLKDQECYFKGLYYEILND